MYGFEPAAQCATDDDIRFVLTNAAGSADVENSDWAVPSHSVWPRPVACLRGVIRRSGNWIGKDLKVWIKVPVSPQTALIR